MSTNKDAQIKEALKEYRKKIYEKNKEKLKKQNLEYYYANKEKIKQQKMEYYQANKEKINKKVTCKCGGTYLIRNKEKHIETKMHQGYLRGLKERDESSDSEEESSSDSSDSD